MNCPLCLASPRGQEVTEEDLDQSQARQRRGSVGRALGRPFCAREAGAYLCFGKSPVEGGGEEERLGLLWAPFAPSTIQQRAGVSEGRNEHELLDPNITANKSQSPYGGIQGPMIWSLAHPAARLSNRRHRPVPAGRPSLLQSASLCTCSLALAVPSTWNTVPQTARSMNAPLSFTSAPAAPTTVRHAQPAQQFVELRNE